MRVTRKGGIKIAVLENGLISTYTAREALMRRLISLDFEVYVLTNANQFTQKVEKIGVQVIDIGSANYNPLRIGSYIKRLKKCFKQIKPDICLTFSIRPAIWGNMIARKMDIPVITNITGTGPLFSSHSLAYALIRKVYPYALKKTEKVFFQNVDDKNQFIRRGFVAPGKCCLIPGSGVDPDKFKPVPEKTAEKAFTFIYIGRMLKDKGVPEFVAAARIIKRNYPDVKFKVIGPVWKQNTRSNRISDVVLHKWEKEGTIEYLGEIADVRPEIGNSECLVLPSHREGMSNVLLEASAMEKPCIASDVPGCREIIDDGVTGFLSKPKDIEDLADKMGKMLNLNTDIRIRMGKAARKRVIYQFDKEVVIRYYLEAVNNILQRNYKNISIFPAGEDMLQEKNSIAAEPQLHL